MRSCQLKQENIGSYHTRTGILKNMRSLHCFWRSGLKRWKQQQHIEAVPLSHNKMVTCVIWILIWQPRSSNVSAEETHNIFKCGEFKKLLVKERADLIEVKNCFNCLRPGLGQKILMGPNASILLKKIILSCIGKLVTAKESTTQHLSGSQMTELTKILQHYLQRQK